jgi:hypothetical protein
VSRWAPANAARSEEADRKAYRLAACMLVSRTFKEAAWRARIPVRTATRLRARIG